MTFEGKTIPRYVSIDLHEVRVDVYIPPVVQCFKCLRYGHSQKQCRGKLRCPNCSEEHDKVNCHSPVPKCIYCKEEHISTSKNCPEFLRQKQIKELMVAENISYYDARKKVPKNYDHDMTQKSQNYRNFRENTPNYDANKRTIVHYDHDPISEPQDNMDFRDFPKLPQKNNQDEISMVQRRLILSQQKSIYTQKPTYAQTTNSKKRRSSSPGYDKKEHEDCLFPSLARSPIQSIRSFTPTSSFKEQVEEVQLFDLVKKALDNTNLSQDIKEVVLSQFTQNEDSMDPSGEDYNIEFSSSC